MLGLTDIIDAKAQFGDMGPGLKIQFGVNAHARLQQFADENHDKQVQFFIGSSLAFQAPCPSSFPETISVPIEGMGNAVWLQDVLLGKKPSK